MKTTTLILTVAAGLMILGTACKKEQKVQEDGLRSLNAGGTPISAGSDTLGPVILSGKIAANRLLSNDTLYYLNGIVTVEGASAGSPATLTIEPGTLIRGLAGTPASGGNPGTPGGVLVIAKNGLINAQGTAAAPIVFTSYRERSGTPASGDWGGIVILGEAPTNKPTTTAIEGINPSSVGYSFDNTYGGAASADVSGILTFVRIEYAGWELFADNELNGLTLGGVGNGTTIRSVEVFQSKDDGFGFFGGTVNASRLVSIDALDDALDFDYGYVGTIDTALLVVDPARADNSQSNGIESDNNATGDSVLAAGLPFTRPVLKRLTVVGVSSAAAAAITNGAPSGTGRYGRSAHLRRSTRFEIRNSIFVGFSNGISLDTTGTSNTGKRFHQGVSILNNNFSQGYSNAYAKEAPTVTFWAWAAPVSNFGITAAQTFLSNPYVKPAEFGGGANYRATFSGAGAIPQVGTDWTATWVRYRP